MTTTPSLHTQAADMLERYGRVNGVMHCEVSMLIAELRASAALDDLTRENERLGLYDDQRPVAWRCRDYVTGCWFISVKPDPAGSIAGESVPLYAAPASTQPRQPLSADDVADALIGTREELAAEVQRLRKARQPLSDEQMDKICSAWRAAESTNQKQAVKRAIERAITGEKP